MNDWLKKKDRHKVWVGEQMIMKMVRDGDLNFKSPLNNLQGVSSGVPVHSEDPLRQAKTSGIVFVSLCVRAAIDGGLSPELGYSLGDAYIQAIESSNSIPEISFVNAKMYEDFVRRVHSCNTNPNVSRFIRDCCNYIQLNVESKLDLSELAARVGYTDYYLSRKFKEEMGITLNQYIQWAKIEQAKTLLIATEDSIQEISDRLNFCSRSYFGEAFRKVVGCSPTKYRKKPKYLQPPPVAFRRRLSFQVK